MKSRSALTILAILVAVSGAWAQDTSGSALLTRARGARTRVQAQLATVRQQQLDQRKVLTAELNEAYKQLDIARRDARVAAVELAKVTAGAERLVRDDAKTQRLIRSLLIQTASAAGEKIAPETPVAEMEKAIWRGLQARIARIEADTKTTVQTESVVARDGQVRDVPVVRLGAWAQYACGPTRETTGRIKSSEDDRMLVAGLMMSPEQCAFLRDFAAGKGEHLPVDPSQTLQDRRAVGDKDLMGWFDTGGIFIYPILVSGLIGLILIIERVFYLTCSKAPGSLTRDVLARTESGDACGALDLAGRSKTPTGRVLMAWLESAGQTEQQRQGAVESALLMEGGRLERSFSLIAALAGAAPLLGLLGTVSGMIATFDTISAVGTGNPQLMSGGISEALITTQLGLMVAIPLLLAHAWLRRWTQRREAMLEYSAMQVLGGDTQGGQA